MDDNNRTLNAGIKINGGDENPKSLEDRELYLNTTAYENKDGFSLWSKSENEIGDNKIKKIKSGVSDSALQFENKSTNTDIKSDTYDKGNTTLKFGNFTIEPPSDEDKSKNKENYKWSTADANDDTIDKFNVFKYVNFNKVGKIILDKSPNMIYGDNLPAPSNSDDGQIFFLLAAEEL